MVKLVCTEQINLKRLINKITVSSSIKHPYYKWMYFMYFSHQSYHIMSTNSNAYYQFTLQAYSNYVQLATNVSGRIANRQVNMKLGWSSILFSKLCVTSVRMLHLIPNN